MCRHDPTTNESIDHSVQSIPPSYNRLITYGSFTSLLGRATPHRVIITSLGSLHDEKI